MKITGIMLAAGTSSRMGPENKLLLTYRGHTIIEEVIRQMSASMVDDIIIVTGHERKRIEEILDVYRDSRINFVHNPEYLSGRGTSIRRAIEFIGDRVDAVLFMVADKPQVSSALINRAIDLFIEKRPSVLYVETPSGRGHPIIFSKRVFPDLLQLQGDLVGNGLVARYADETVQLKDAVDQTDIDTEDDYRNLMRGVSRL